jgi:hypothetical protein
MLNTKEEVTSFMFKLGYFKKEPKALENADYFVHRAVNTISKTVETTFIWHYKLSAEENLLKLFEQIWIIAQVNRDYQILYELPYKKL